jgi:hypothetical protein
MGRTKRQFRKIVRAVIGEPHLCRTLDKAQLSYWLDVFGYCACEQVMALWLTYLQAQQHFKDRLAPNR